MASHPASMARRQRERARVMQQKEKQAKRQERRDQKGKATGAASDDPMNDPTIDWADAVREQPVAQAEDEDGEATEAERES